MQTPIEGYGYVRDGIAADLRNMTNMQHRPTRMASILRVNHGHVTASAYSRNAALSLFNQRWMAAQVAEQYTPQLVSYQAVQQYLAQYEWQVKQALRAPCADVPSRPLMCSHSETLALQGLQSTQKQRKRDRRDCGKHGGTASIAYTANSKC